MSVLSRPQGTPERVWSLVGGLGALGGEVDRADFVSLVNPGYVKAGNLTQAAQALAGDAPGVASALGLVERDGARTRLTLSDPPPDLAGFADRVHDLLCGIEPGCANGVVLEAFAWVAVEAQRRQGLEWLWEMGRDEFADALDNALVGEDEDGRLMNTTKVPAWRRWLRAMGLGVPMPDRGVDYPSAARRVGIELRRAGVAPGTTMSAEDFVRLVAGRCPYLDRGRLFVLACRRAGYEPPPRSLSPVLSVAIRDLEWDGVIETRLSGDAADSLSMSLDPSVVQPTFNSVVIARTRGA